MNNFINKLKQWYNRKRFTVQVGDVWEEKNINPFATKLRFRVIDVKDGWAKFQGLKDGFVFEWNFETVEMMMNLVEENK